MSATVVFYVSAHGFGHASRDVEVINALLARRPDIAVVIRSAAPEWLFERTIRGPFRVAPLEADPGIVQIDSLRLDAEATVARATAYTRTLEARTIEEAEALRALRPDLVVADIPPLGLAAAAHAGVPALALGNFTWDWIYAGYEGGAEAARCLGEVYAKAGRALRLPMWGGFETFTEIVDVPFIARHSRRDPHETREALGLPAGERLALISFGGYGLEGIDVDRLSRVDGHRVLVSASVPFGPDRRPLSEAEARGSLLPFDEPAMYARGFRYEDLVRAVDVVVTKPGYGIIAECLANETAVLYTSRGHFVEYDVLVAAMPRFLRSRFIPQADLFAGRWGAHLDAVAAQPAPPEAPATNGAEVVAQVILREIGETQG